MADAELSSPFARVLDTELVDGLRLCNSLKLTEEFLVQASIATCQHKLVYFCQHQTRVGAVFRPLHQLKVLPFEMPNTLRYLLIG